VRIGSRSKSVILEDYNLRERVKSHKKRSRTQAERREEGKRHCELNDIAMAGKEIVETLTNGSSKLNWKRVENLLKLDFPHQYAQLSCEPDEDGFLPIAGKNGNFFDFWIMGRDIEKTRFFLEPQHSQQHTRNVTDRPPESILRVSESNIWELSKDERQCLAQHWESHLRDQGISSFMALDVEFSNSSMKLNKLQDEYRVRALEDADIVGLTTTGLAQFASVLERVNFKVLICEEAGEVLEVWGRNLH